MSSNLAFINVVDKFKPIVLFRRWHEVAESNECATTNLLNLATATKDGYVSNRTVALRDLSDDLELTFVCSNSGTKYQNLEENPQVGATFLWIYNKYDDLITHQVKIEGRVEKLPADQCKKYYDEDPLHYKIRSHICSQGAKVDWDELKTKHDQFLGEVLEANKPTPLEEMPKHLVAYKIVPHRVDFYYSTRRTIADRIVFERRKSESQWSCHRIAT